ncbi:MAG: hypothetical protein MJE68_13580 [Proteobacteria bacterium]|nr:hypothetical protein [Pseudomonadota bacterium]
MQDRNDSARKSVGQSQPQVEPVVQVQIEIHTRNEESTDKSKIEIQSGIKQLANNDSSGLVEKEENASGLPPKDENDSSKRRQDGNVPSMQVLKLLAKNKYKQCLTHPLVVQYLYLKWKDYMHTCHTPLSAGWLFCGLSFYLSSLGYLQFPLNYSRLLGLT